MRARGVVEVRSGSRLAVGAARNDASLRIVGVEWSSQLGFVVLAAERINERPWRFNCVRWSVRRGTACHVGPNDLDGDGGVHGRPSNE